MSREIKFRIWDCQCKEMSFDSSTWDFDIFKAPDVVVMQFTGLKDKNGREIYEGDVLHTDVKNMDGSLNWVVEWDETQLEFDFVGIGHSFSSCHNQVDEECEVIGNIYSNPEILKG